MAAVPEAFLVPAILAQVAVVLRDLCEHSALQRMGNKSET